MDYTISCFEYLYPYFIVRDSDKNFTYIVEQERMQPLFFITYSFGSLLLTHVSILYSNLL